MRRLDWFIVSKREQFIVGVPLDIVDVSQGYLDAIAAARASIDRPHDRSYRDLLTAQCNDVAEALIEISREDESALSLGASLRAMILEAAKQTIEGA